MRERRADPASVEPLTPQAWQRVEAGLFARLEDGVFAALVGLASVPGQ